MKEKKSSALRFWLLVWGLGLIGQLVWNIENQWFNTFVYAKIAKDPTIISWMVAISAIATTISTFVFGTLSDRKGRRKTFIGFGYILWGIFTILFGTTEFITSGKGAATAKLLMLAATAVVLADALMSFFGSMGNDAGFNVWLNDNMTEKNRGHIGAALATHRSSARSSAWCSAACLSAKRTTICASSSSSAVSRSSSASPRCSS